MSVLRKATAVTESTFDSLPALKPYQPNQSRPVPRATSGMLCGPRSDDIALPDVEHRSQRGDAGDVMHDDAAGEVQHAPLRKMPPPQTMWTKGKYTSNSQPVRKIM